MSKTGFIEIEGIKLAITRLSAAGKSAKDIQNYFECEQILSGEKLSSGKASITKPFRRKRRKNLKEGILKFLASQGKKGAHVKAIAAAVRSNPENITIWAYTTGKKVKGLKKVAPATYAYAAK